MPNIQEIIKDPNFISLPDTEKIKVFKALDPNFSALPEMEQGKVISSLSQQPQQVNTTLPGGPQSPIDADTQQLKQVDTTLPGGLQSPIDGEQPFMQVASIKESQPTQTPEGRKEKEEARDLFFKGVPEVAGTIASSAIAEPAAGLAGIAGAILPGEEGQGSRFVESTKKALTRLPKSESGKSALEATGKALKPVGDFMEAIESGLGDFAFEVTGSPAIAASAASTPTLLMELVGLKGLKSLKAGTKLLENGKPTKALRIALNKKGIDFDSLTPDARAAIPETIEPGLLRTEPVKNNVEKAIVQQIKSGGTDDALAGLRVVGDDLLVDPVAAKAIKQGFSPGLVQSIKASNKSTKAKMEQMTSIMRRIKTNERLSADIRPSDVVGDSVGDRLGYIKLATDKARLDLDRIAKQNLPGKQVSTDAVIKTLEESLDDLDVNLKTPAKGGKPTPEFKGSLISKDKSSQRVIRDLVDLMGEGGRPDALRMHKLKRQLDIIIDFNKQSAMGLSDAGKKVLKKVRRSLNETLRNADPQYAKTNDILFESIGAMEDIDKAVGTIDIFGKGSSKAIGQKMRALLSNQQGRVRLENALDSINETAKNLGAKFDDDIKELVVFADGLDDRFGTTAKTSFAGQITQANKEAARRIKDIPTSKSGIAGAAVNKVGAGIEKLRGINDFEAFESLTDLLKRDK